MSGRRRDQLYVNACLSAAIDINGKYANYWRWALNNRGEPKWISQIPIQIVQIFEKHGFIWGGYWYHYDTMHFEYRPEFLNSDAVCDLTLPENSG